MYFCLKECMILRSTVLGKAVAIQERVRNTTLKPSAHNASNRNIYNYLRNRESHNSSRSIIRFLNHKAISRSRTLYSYDLYTLSGTINLSVVASKFLHARNSSIKATFTRSYRVFAIGQSRTGIYYTAVIRTTTPCYVLAMQTKQTYSARMIIEMDA